LDGKTHVPRWMPVRRNLRAFLDSSWVCDRTSVELGSDRVYAGRYSRNSHP
jgi:hypothetical protein